MRSALGRSPLAGDRRDGLGLSVARKRAPTGPGAAMSSLPTAPSSSSERCAHQPYARPWVGARLRATVAMASGPPSRFMVFDGIAYPNPDQVALGGLHPPQNRLSPPRGSRAASGSSGTCWHASSASRATSTRGSAAESLRRRHSRRCSRSCSMLKCRPDLVPYQEPVPPQARAPTQGSPADVPADRRGGPQAKIPVA
jgi:hypothetical protein